MREGDRAGQLLTERLHDAGGRWRALNQTAIAGASAVDDPVVVVEAPMPDRPYRGWSSRHRWGRGHLLGVATVAAVGAALVIALVSVLGRGAAGPVGDSATSTTGTGAGQQDAPPDAVRASVLDQLQAQQVVRFDPTVQWVQTTAGKVPDSMGIAADTAVYVVQMTGSFVCRSCKNVGPPITGTTIVQEFAVSDPTSSSDFSLSKTSLDLAALGDVHSFTVDYPLTSSS